MDRAQRSQDPPPSSLADPELSLREAVLGVVVSGPTLITQMGRLSLRLRGARGLSESWAELELESRC